MSARIIIVWDIGKTNAKLAAADAQSGEVRATLTQGFAPLPGPPYQHLDVDGLWAWFTQSVPVLVAGAQVEAIIVTAHGATAALIDADGLVLPILDYEDDGPAETEKEYAKLRPPFAQTLSPPLPGSLNYGRGLYWQSRRFAGEFGRARHILSYVQYWSWRLAGVAATECSTIGSHSDLWLPQLNTFSSLVAALGWERLFPPLRRADEILGPIRPELAAELGISPQAKIYCGIHDSNASLLPWLGRPKPFTISSTGTWVINLGLGASLAKLDPKRDCAANVSIYGDPLASSRWMGGREYALVAGDTRATASREELAKVLASEDLLVLPNQGGQGGPFLGRADRPNQKVEQAAPGVRAAAAALYCALMLDETFALIDSAGDIVIEGAFAANELLGALVATLRAGQRVYASADRTGTTAGALRLALPALPPPATRPIAPLDDGAKLIAARSSWRRRLS